MKVFFSEHQELEHQIEAAQDEEQKKDLQRDLERLVSRMEEKEAQITKLRKHQETVFELLFIAATESVFKNI